MASAEDNCQKMKKTKQEQQDEHRHTIGPGRDPHRPSCLAPAGLDDRREASVAHGWNFSGTQLRRKPMNSVCPCIATVTTK